MPAVASKKKPSRKAPPSGKGLTFEKVWALMQELAEKEAEREAKLNKKLAAQEAKWKEDTEKAKQEAAEERKELDRRLKETDRIVRRNGKQLGEVHRRFGQLAEHLVAPGIAKRFNELGYNFDLMAPKGIKILDENGKIKTEIDLLLENGKTIIAVEVKSRPVIQDVEHHIKRLEILRDKRSLLNDQRKVQGGIAGAIYEDEVKKAVREAGLFVIEQSGDTMKIDMPDGFIPREW